MRALRRLRGRRLIALLGVLGVLAGGLSALAGRVAAQDYSPPQPPPPAAVPPPPQPGPPPGGFPVEIGGDRPRDVPQHNQARVPLITGVEVGVGALALYVDSRVMNFQQGPDSPFNDGMQVTVSFLLDQWRLEYAKLLLRRGLPKGALYNESPIKFLGVDIDQFWVFYGWHPIYSLYLAGGLAYEHRVVRIGPNFPNPLTDNPLAAAAIVEWAVAPPASLQLRVYQEQQMDLLTIHGTVYQIGGVTSF